jgi:hypothetical protein
MTTRVQFGGRFLAIVVILSLGILAFPASSVMAHGGGGGGGGHGGGMGGMGGHMGGMGMGGMGMGGMGMGMGGMGGHMGGMGGFGGFNRGFGFNRGLGFGGLGGFGGFGFFPGFWGGGFGYPFWGGYGLGWGYPYYGGYGLGWGGYGYPYYGGYGYGYDPYYGYGGGYGYGYPYYGYASNAGGVPVTYTSAYVAPGASAANIVLPQGRYLGIDEEPVVDTSGRKGMKISNVYPGTPAQRAGLRVGDVIYSINGYLTEQRGNLAWIIANAAPNNQLNLTVKRSTDGQERAVTAVMP